MRLGSYSIRRRAAAKINLLFLVTVIVNILIPKAGIKIAGIPLTAGNVLLGMLFIYTLCFMGIGKLRMSKYAFICLSAALFWTLRIGLSVGGAALSEIIGYLIPLCVYPFVFLVVPLYITRREQIERLVRIILFCFVCLLLYTLLQAAVGIGRVCIPGITVNYSDYIANPSGWWLDKNNAVGSASKMVGTYQNGNILGVALLLLFPLVLSAVRKNWVKACLWVLFVACVLFAGSRTVYIGLIILCLYYIFRQLGRFVFCDVRIKISTLILVYLLTCVAIGGLVYFVLAFDTDMFNRILSLFDFDTMMQGAGRTASAFRYFRWLWDNPVAILFGGYGMRPDGGAYEMTYICVFMLGGVIGLCLFLYFVFSTIAEIRRRAPRGKLKSGIVSGLVIYFIAAFIEGAYWLPPTAINVWLIAGLGYSLVQMAGKDTILCRKKF